ncbi:hypothetical protein [Caballeronia arvi]|uniref:hypothetical protein n=1 Tax=Caballeronia arvi TaxID=1777135 RepID=UPI00077256FB|nr:hypothetical protein [Caballeronia arvi]
MFPSRRTDFGQALILQSLRNDFIDESGRSRAVPGPATNKNQFGAKLVQELLRETRGVGVAFAGLGIGTGVGLSAAIMIWAADVDIIRGGSVSFWCLAAGMFFGFTLVVGYGIRLKTILDRLSPLVNDIETWCSRIDAISEATSVETVSFGRAARRTHLNLYPAALKDEAEKQTTVLLERLMLPRKH